MKWLKAGILFFAAAVIFGSCSTDNEPLLTGSNMDDDYSVCGVWGWCLEPPGYPVNGVLCEVIDMNGNPYPGFGTDTSHTDPVNGEGFYFCQISCEGPFPEEGEELLVQGYWGGEPWGTSFVFEWHHPIVRRISVWKY